MRPARAGTLALALSLLVLAACGAPGGTARDSNSQPPSKAAESSSEALSSNAALDPPAPGQALEPPVAPEQKTTRAPAVPLTPVAPIAPINDDPDQLMGLAPHAVSHLLGPPSLLRTEIPAQVWQYTAANCVLDIYLYAEDEAPDRSRVTYYEIRRTQSPGSGRRACFADIIARRNLAADTTPES
ncbi:MAG: hypothetical protein O3B21_04800 [Proteobacteria bacterium]|nr:hypothetical protein [Pseudomonadota bacterium]MDA1356245.1 hypothetical protein [Pseudomonadota bacterium]